MNIPRKILSCEGCEGNFEGNELFVDFVREDEGKNIETGTDLLILTKLFGYAMLSLLRQG